MPVIYFTCDSQLDNHYYSFHNYNLLPLDIIFTTIHKTRLCTHLLCSGCNFHRKVALALGFRGRNFIIL